MFTTKNIFDLIDKLFYVLKCTLSFVVYHTHWHTDDYQTINSNLDEAKLNFN